MDYLQFMNSKTLFKVSSARAGRGNAAPHAAVVTGLQFQRKDPVGKNRLPVMVHINYHPDKVRSAGRAFALSSLVTCLRRSGSA